MSRNLRRYTNTKYPSKPTTLAQIKEAYEDPSTMQKFGFNLRSTKRFYIDTIETKNGGFTIFASHEIMQMIDDIIPPEDRKYMLDGTFDVTPIGRFYQLLIITIDYKKDVSANEQFSKCSAEKRITNSSPLQIFPVFFVLMTNKRTELYLDVFKYIDDNVFQLQPAQFMADFEAGLRKAIQTHYPEASLYGCWYHYCASIRRRLMSLSMYRLITDDRTGAQIYRMMLSLPLLPKERILDGFGVVKRVAKENRLHKEFKKFFDYFEDFWMKLVSLNYIVLRSKIAHTRMQNLSFRNTVFVRR